MPPPAINTGFFVTRWTDLHLDEFHYPLNDSGSKPAFDRRSDARRMFAMGGNQGRIYGVRATMVQAAFVNTM